MGKVVLTIKDGYGRQSKAVFKCANANKAKSIADRRPNCVNYVFYETGETIPQSKAKDKPTKDEVLAKLASELEST